MLQNPRTIPELLRCSVSRFPDNPALTDRARDGDRTITYRELSVEVEKLSAGLQGLGLKPGERCAILGGNSPEWGKAYLAAATAGLVNVPIDSFLSPNEIKHLIAAASVKAIFVSSRFLDMILDSARGTFKGLNHIICMDFDPGDLPEGVFSLNDLKSVKGKRRFLKGRHEPGPDDIASLIFTSGTTGAPKGVMLSHWNIVSDVIACYDTVGDHLDLGRERFLSVLPLHHAFEFTAGFMLPLYMGSWITYARSLKSKQIMEDLAWSRATILFGVPLLYQKMMAGIKRGVAKAPASKRAVFRGMWRAVLTAEKMGMRNAGRRIFASFRKKAGFGSIKFFISGGAPLSPDISLFFRRLGLTILQGYGLTEASPVLSINPAEAPKDASVGKPLVGVDVKVVDPGQDGIGELAFRGPMITKGYFNDPETTKKVIDRDGWLYTGDLGYIDNEGYIFISGRHKNLIVTAAGKNVYPEEIEPLLNGSRFIFESMVYGKLSKRSNGEEVHAVIVPDFEALAQAGIKNPSDKELKELIGQEVQKVNRHLAAFKRIKEFLIMSEEFPKTSTRKIKRHLLKL